MMSEATYQVCSDSELWRVIAINKYKPPMKNENLILWLTATKPAMAALTSVIITLVKIRIMNVGSVEMSPLCLSSSSPIWITKPLTNH